MTTKTPATTIDPNRSWNNGDLAVTQAPSVAASMQLENSFRIPKKCESSVFRLKKKDFQENVGTRCKYIGVEPMLGCFNLLGTKYF